MTLFSLPRLDESATESATCGTGETSGFGALRTSVGNLPLKQLQYQTRIVGLAVHTTIAQTYYNPFDECIEATYIFPIEGEQAVIDCQMWIGTRVVRASLKERGQARADYQRAIARGHRAALLEENRPETFSMKVGNIAPGEAVQVRIETVGHLPVVDGEWTLRIPLVVAPRYTSGFALPQNFASQSAGNGVAVDTDQVPDASAVSPPTWLPGFASPVDLKLEVTVTPGSLATRSDWPSRLRCSLHAVSTQASGDGEAKSCSILVQPGERINRDFILRGTYAESSIVAAIAIEPSPQSAQPTPADDRSAFAIQIVPPKVDAKVSRDIVFLLDRSGSMGGWKMDAARRGISRLIDSLSPDDCFRVIVFDDKVESPPLGDPHPLLQGLSIPRGNGVHWASATDANRYEAVRWLAKIEARGGTEMGMAIKHSLDGFVGLPSPEIGSPMRARAIVLVTDGQITGEDSLLRLLGQSPESQRPRIFCLGVDRAVNGSVLQRLTKLTGGTYELVESHNRLDEVMKRFASEIGSPALSDLEVIAENSSADFQWVPSNAKTLYAGRAMSIYGRVPPGLPLAITLRGRLASGQLWQTRLDVPANLDQPTGAATLLPMWARGRIRELEDRLTSQSNRDLSLKQQIIDCSLGSRVLSRYTAFVAVDESERVNVDGHLHQVTQPVELPDGWQEMSMMTIDRSRLIPIPGKQPLATEQTAAPNNLQTPRSGLFSLPPDFESQIVRQGIVSEDQLRDAADFASRSGKSVSDALLEMQYASADEIAKVTADAYRLPYVELQSAAIDQDVIELVPESVARENTILPVSETHQSLTIAISDPADLETIEKLRFILNRDIRTVVASHESIVSAINTHYGQVEGESVDCLLQEFTDTAIDFSETTIDFTETTDDRDIVYGEVEDDQYDGISINSLSAEPPALASGIFGAVSYSLAMPFMFKRPSTPAPVVKLVELILKEAISLRATHVILRPENGAICVVYVIDGVEVQRDRVPGRLRAALVTRLKVLCKLNITATNPLQSGRCPVTVNGSQQTCEVHFRETSEGISILIDFVSLPVDQTADPIKAWWAQP